jgi:hypothetical protein
MQLTVVVCALFSRQSSKWTGKLALLACVAGAAIGKKSELEALCTLCKVYKQNGCAPLVSHIAAFGLTCSFIGPNPTSLQ